MSTTAAANSIAFYSSNNTVPLGNGIILSTGTIIDSEINKPASNTLSTDNGMPGDMDTDALCGGTSYDACIIEFDCVPTNSNLVFDFAFASEEYNEFVNSGLNDEFAIIVSGPNPSGGNYTKMNFALIPNSNIPVSIGNVNNGTPDPLIPNSPTSYGPCKNCAYFIDNTYSAIIAFDGYTADLKGFVPVIAGQSYHFKIAIADNVDSYFDSAVLLKTNSFQSVSTTDLEKLNATANDLMIYPIPAKDKIYYSSKVFKALKAELYTVDGRKMDNVMLDNTTSSIDVKHLAKGIYFLKLINDGNVITKKVIIE